MEFKCATCKQNTEIEPVARSVVAANFSREGFKLDSFIDDLEWLQDIQKVREKLMDGHRFECNKCSKRDNTLLHKCPSWHNLTLEYEAWALEWEVGAPWKTLHKEYKQCRPKLAEYERLHEKKYKIVSPRRMKSTKTTQQKTQKKTPWNKKRKSNALDKKQSGPPCKCMSPLPSVKRQVKKEGHNKGKWFFGCSRYPNHCDFFEFCTQGGRTPLK